MSLSNCTQSPAQNLTFDTQEWYTLVRPEIQEYVVTAALPLSLYGIFVLLCGASIYSLVQLNARTRRTTLMLSLAVLALFCSTTIYTVTNFLGMLEEIFQQYLTAIELWHVNCSEGPSPFSGTKQAFIFCAPTATLTINILLGDAIVCWRVCILWRYNRAVMGTCIILLLTTFALGTVDTAYNCPILTGSNPLSQADPHSDGNGNLYSGFSYGVAATALSLATNLFATMAVIVKGWQSQKMLKKYVVTGPKASQMGKVLSLLVESGTIYCALWVVVLAWQAKVYTEGGLPLPGTNDFGDIFNVFVNGALVPLIAIYPTAIIVLVALNRSHIESGFTTPTRSSVNRLSLWPPGHPVNAAVTNRSESQHREMFERISAIGGQDFLSAGTPESLKANTVEERKLGDIV